MDLSAMWKTDAFLFYIWSQHKNYSYEKNKMNYEIKINFYSISIIKWYQEMETRVKFCKTLIDYVKVLTASIILYPHNTNKLDIYSLNKSIN